MSKIGTRLMRAREPIGDPKALNAPTPVNPRFANVQSRLLGQTGSHIGNVKEKKDYSHESFRRVTRTELVDTLAYILKKLSGELETSVGQAIVDVANMAVVKPEYLPPSGRRPSESKSSSIAGSSTPSNLRSASSRSNTPSRARPSSNQNEREPASGAAMLLSTIVPMTAAFHRMLPKDCEPYLIDVRDESSFTVNHIFGAVSYPVIQLRRGIITPDLYAFKQGERRAVIIYANHESSDNSGIEAAELLIGKYFENVFLLTGGLDGVADRFPDWILGDLPPQRGPSGFGMTSGKATPVVYGTGSGLGIRPGTNSRVGSGMGRRTPVPGLTDTIGREMARAQAVATAIGFPSQAAFQSIQAGVYPYAKTSQGRDLSVRPVFQIARHSATPTVTRDGAPLPYGSIPQDSDCRQIMSNPQMSADPLSGRYPSSQGRATPTSYYTMPSQNSGTNAGHLYAPQLQQQQSNTPLNRQEGSLQLSRNRERGLGSGLPSKDDFDPQRDTFVTVYGSTIRRSAEAQTPIHNQGSTRATPAVSRSEKNASHWSLSEMGDTPSQRMNAPSTAGLALDIQKGLGPNQTYQSHTFHQDQQQDLQQQHYSSSHDNPRENPIPQPQASSSMQALQHRHPQGHSPGYHQFQNGSNQSSNYESTYNQSDNQQLSPEQQVQFLEQQIRDLQMQIRQTPDPSSNRSYESQEQYQGQFDVYPQSSSHQSFTKPVLRGHGRR